MIRDLYHIHSNKWLTGDIWEMRLIGDVYPITAPGQFINVKADGGPSRSATGTRRRR